ncbi:MAG: 50S ribosomal protein L30 [Proteobacteria bacterium]|jgi:large subunit ribosomal protein L30|nr:50S ribosomal protein L30 [Pseudomonadota bacterium]NLN61638.1 50S ribosomal protein L30 [Myxococcales bacterium]
MPAVKLKVTQIRSCIGQCQKNRAVVKGLGLTGIGKTVVVENSPAFRGMIKKVIHLVKVEEANV